MNITEKLRAHAASLSEACEEMDSPEIKDAIGRLSDACYEVGRSWSGSWIGYQSRVYIDGFRRPSAGETFSAEWGLMMGHGPWREYSPEEVWDEILRRSGDADMVLVREAAQRIEKEFDLAKDEAVPMLAAYEKRTKDSEVQHILSEIRKLPSSIGDRSLAFADMPTGPMVSRDVRALHGQYQAPPHIAVLAEIQSHFSAAVQAKSLEKLLLQAAAYIEHLGEFVTQIESPMTDQPNAPVPLVPKGSFWTWWNPLTWIWVVAIRLPILVLKDPSRWSFKVISSLAVGAGVAWAIYTFLAPPLGAFVKDADPRQNAAVSGVMIAAFFAASNLAFSMLKEVR